MKASTFYRVRKNLFSGQRLPLPRGSCSRCQNVVGEFRLAEGQAVGGGDEEVVVGPHGHRHRKNYHLLHASSLSHKVFFNFFNLLQL